jgi:Flp pilus assembly pilin Flp
LKNLRWLSGESGQVLAEYALVLTLVFLAVLAVITSVTGKINEMYHIIWVFGSAFGL